MRTVLTTVGTALLGNAKRDMGIEAPTLDDLVRYLGATDSAKASAEMNVLGRLLLEDRDEVVLLHSETLEGELCAGALERFLSSKCSCGKRLLPGIDYRQGFQAALARFVAILIEELAKARKGGRDVSINAAGGFKAQFAGSGLVGLLFKVPVYYIHELHRDLVVIPPIPITWDMNLFAIAEWFFEWIEEDVRSYDEVHERLRSFDPETRGQIEALLETEDGCTLLSASGTAFFEAFRVRTETDPSTVIFLSDYAVKQLQNGGHRQVSKKLVDKISNQTVREHLSGNKVNSDCRFFPGAEAKDEHVVFFEENGSVVVGEFSYSHTERDRRLDDNQMYKSNYVGRTPAKEAFGG